MPIFLELPKFGKFISMGQINSFCFSVLLGSGIIYSCSQPSVKPGKDKIPEPISTISKVETHDTLRAINLFTLSDAEKILGESAHLADSGTTTAGVVSNTSVNDSVLPIKRMASAIRCAYEANAEDKKTGRTGKVYFLIENYPNVSSAMTVYSYYKRSNEKHPGFKELHDMGDEGWFGDSPLFVYVRKSNKIFVMKVNKMTSKTSFDGFDQVVKNIAATL
jgi:hypothetical protein